MQGCHYKYHNQDQRLSSSCMGGNAQCFHGQGKWKFAYVECISDCSTNVRRTPRLWALFVTTIGYEDSRNTHGCHLSPKLATNWQGKWF